MKQLTVMIVVLILCGCSTQNGNPEISKIITCSTWREDHNLNKWKPILQKAINQDTSLFHIGGSCDLPDGTSWISYTSAFISGSMTDRAKIVHITKDGMKLKIINGYDTNLGDVAACGFKEMIGNQLIVFCESGVSSETVSVNTETDERIVLSSDYHGEEYEKYLNNGDEGSTN